MEPKCGQSSGEGDVFMTKGKKFMKDNTELKNNQAKYKGKKKKRLKEKNKTAKTGFKNNKSKNKSKKQKAKGKGAYERQHRVEVQSIKV